MNERIKCLGENCIRAVGLKVTAAYNNCCSLLLVNQTAKEKSMYFKVVSGES